MAAKKKKRAKRRAPAKRRTSNAAATLSVAKKVASASRKRCGNPKRTEEAENALRYLGEQFRLEQRLGPTVRSKAAVKSNLVRLAKGAKRILKVVNKCNKKAVVHPERIRQRIGSGS